MPKNISINLTFLPKQEIEIWVKTHQELRFKGSTKALAMRFTVMVHSQEEFGQCY